MLHFDTTLCIFSKCFVELVKESNAEEYEFTLPETRTYDIIQDVKNMRSEIGIIPLTCFFVRLCAYFEYSTVIG